MAMAAAPVPLLVLDTETTGLSPEVDRVVEIAAVCVDPDAGTVTPVVDVLVNPGRPIPPAASAVHHLTDEDVADAEPFDRVWSAKVAPLLGPGTVIAAHNARFDRQFVPEMPNPWLCTMRLAKHLWPDAPAYGNQVLRYWRSLRIETGAPHRALSDATVTGHLLLELVASYRQTVSPEGALDLAALAQYAAAPFPIAVMPFGKHKGTPLEEVPPDYVRWLLALDDLDVDLRFSLERIVRRRQETA